MVTHLFILLFLRDPIQIYNILLALFPFHVFFFELMFHEVRRSMIVRTDFCPKPNPLAILDLQVPTAYFSSKSSLVFQVVGILALQQAECFQRSLTHQSSPRLVRLCSVWSLPKTLANTFCVNVHTNTLFFRKASLHMCTILIVVQQWCK